MAFVLKKIDELIPVRIRFDPNRPYLRPAKDADPGSLEELVFHRRVFVGHDTRDFADSIEESKRGGPTQSKYGTVLMKKIIRGYVKIEGLEGENGRPITRMTEDVFDRLPDWIIDDLTEGLGDEDLSKVDLEGE